MKTTFLKTNMTIPLCISYIRAFWISNRSWDGNILTEKLKAWQSCSQKHLGLGLARSLRIKHFMTLKWTKTKNKLTDKNNWSWTEKQKEHSLNTKYLFFPKTLKIIIKWQCHLWCVRTTFLTVLLIEI